MLNVWPEPYGTLTAPEGVIVPLAPAVAVTMTVSTAKSAESVMAPFIVTLAGFEVPVNDPAPVPFQDLKMKPVFGKAWIWTVPRESKKPDAGLTEPPFPAATLSLNCVPNDAVKVAFVSGRARTWNLPPPSLHEFQ